MLTAESTQLWQMIVLYGKKRMVPCITGKTVVLASLLVSLWCSAMHVIDLLEAKAGLFRGPSR